MKTIKIAICDDDKTSAQNLKKVIESFSVKDMIIKCCVYTDSKILAKEILIQNYNAYFLDINMPDITGIGLAEIIRAKDLQAFIVFVTHYKEYMSEVFQYQAFDYLVKPFDKSDIFSILKKFSRILNRKKVFSFICENKTFTFFSDEIIYFEKLGRYAIIHCTFNRTYKTRISSKELLEKLNSDFLRVHNSFIINLNWLHTFSFKEVTLKKQSDSEITKVPLPIRNIGKM